MKTYLVGGAVRDQLLGLPVKDKDRVVVGGTPEIMLARGFQQIGAAFPVFLHPDTKEEYALARTEKKHGTGYKGFHCFFSPDVTLEEDLKRRDLTINAMAQDHDGTIIDPCHGQADLQARRLRHISPAFREDPLRVLRVARFAARFHHLGFTIADETIEMMRHIVSSGEVKHLTPERVWQETERALSEQSPGTYFNVLRTVGALRVIMPELDNLFGLPQPGQHPEAEAEAEAEVDTGHRSLVTLDIASRLTTDTQVRFAALTCKLAGINLVKALCLRLRIPNDFRELACLACEYHSRIHRAFELDPKTVLQIIKSCDALRRPGRFRQLLLVCEADAPDRGSITDNSYPQSAWFQKIVDTLGKITIRDLIDSGLKGPQLGDAIYARQIRHIREAATNMCFTEPGTGCKNSESEPV
ncbi:MAG: multifunctional CCA addition/repair protein [Gammaproteobacteria bacterium]|nr:MAG: multifunctional CCA addition/repair protein [Pseudomonadota bacterium]PIE38840.1 MAG: multifunctional CCA addition/repair protein [Gammaproteobacteria bacterium]